MSAVFHEFACNAWCSKGNEEALLRDNQIACLYAVSKAPIHKFSQPLARNDMLLCGRMLL